MTNEDYEQQQNFTQGTHEDVPKPELNIQLQSIDELKDIERSTKGVLGDTVLDRDKYSKLFEGEPGVRFYRYYQDLVDRVRVETRLTDVLEEFGDQMDISGENPKYLNINKDKVKVDKTIPEGIRGIASANDNNMRLRDRYTRKATFASLAHYKTHPSIKLAETTFAHEDSHLDLFSAIKEIPLKPEVSARSLFDLKNLLGRRKTQSALERFVSVPEYHRALESHALLVDINFVNYQGIADGLIKAKATSQFESQEDVDSSYKPMLALKALGYSQKQITQIIAEDFRGHIWNGENPYTHVNTIIQSRVNEGEDMDNLVERYLTYRSIQRLKASRVAIELINSYEDDPEELIDTASITLDDLSGE